MSRFWVSFLVSLHLLLSKGYSQGTLRTKYREWLEKDDRIEVKSWYGESLLSLSPECSFSFMGTIDAWSGATPTGLPPSKSRESNPNEWLNVVSQEIRKAGLFTIGKNTPNFGLEFEYGISDEPDYFSKSYAIRYSKKFASETLIVNSGLSLQEDEVKNYQNLFVSKDTPTLSLGISRILDKFTSLSCNLSHSWPNGYLSDPYKGIAVNERFPFIPNEIFMFEENRPSQRKIYTFQTEISRYLESVEIGSHLDYRLFLDDSDLSGHTVEVEMNKRFFDSWILTPRYRFYRQEQASYYSPKVRKFESTMVNPDDTNGPFYSADYRLSAFDSHTFGLKISHLLSDAIIFDAGYDRYTIYGRDKFTEARVYPQADVFTLGLQWQF